MNDPVRVTVVRPKLSTSGAVGNLLTVVGDYALTGLMLMLALGAWTPWHLGYWASVGVLATVRSVFGAPIPAHKLWTAEK